MSPPIDGLGLPTLARAGVELAYLLDGRLSRSSARDMLMKGC